MSEVVLGVLGALAGLAVALLANLFLLPIVLRQQERWVPDVKRTPITGWNNHNMKLYSTFMYRFALPVFLAVVGWAGAVQMFGGAK
jgi:hypothetical protein